MAEGMSEQTIIRAPRGSEHPYFNSRRATAQDRRLTWEARGILWYLLSKPDDWKIIVPDLEQKCGRDRVYRILKELESFGYIVREQQHNELGQFESFVDRVYEIPVKTSLPETPDWAEPESAEPPLHIKEGKEEREEKTPSAGAKGEGDFSPTPSNPAPNGILPTEAAPSDNQKGIGDYNALEQIIIDTFGGKKSISNAGRNKLRAPVSSKLLAGKTEPLPIPSDLYENDPIFPDFIARQLKYWKKREDTKGQSMKYPCIESICDYFGDYGWILYHKSVMSSANPPKIKRGEMPPDDQISWAPE